MPPKLYYKKVKKTDMQQHIGKEFSIPGSYWNGSTPEEQEELYPIEVVKIDAAHKFKGIRNAEPAFGFVLTRPEDQEHNPEGGDCEWIGLSEYSKFLAAWEEERAALLSRASELEGAAGRSASERDYLKDLLVAREGDIARLEAAARVAAVDADAADRLRRGEASGSGALVLALVSRVDDLLVERDELRSTLLELWGKTKDLVQAPEH